MKVGAHSGWGVALVANLTAAACMAEPASTQSLLPEGCADSVDVAPSDLRCTGLYDARDPRVISARARLYAPAVALWTDGAEKRRWIELPDGTSIDGALEDGWRFPVGTKAWKEFSFAGRRVETRYFRKVREDRWLSAAYLWSEDELTATRTDGADIDLGTFIHRVPSASECNACHDGKTDRLLGFEMLSLGLPGASGLDLKTLAAENRIVPSPRSVTLSLPPGEEALGWMHANCGASCHNASSTSEAYATGLQLDLTIDELLSRPTHTWRARTTSVGVDAHTPRWQGRKRVVSGRPDESLLVQLVRARGDDQMPPIGTKVVDPDGTRAVERWVEALSAP